jgi:hypothetical protein
MDQGHATGLNQLSGFFAIARGQSMMDGICWKRALGQPLRRDPVQGCKLVAIPFAQQCAQQISEHVVVTIQGPFRIKRDKKQVRSFDLSKPSLGIGLT